MLCEWMDRQESLRFFGIKKLDMIFSLRIRVISKIDLDLENQNIWLSMLMSNIMIPGFDIFFRIYYTSF